MKNEEFYANKPIIMVNKAERLITPFGPLYVADRDFLTFELSFFYYFIYDYKMFSQLDNEFRGRILNTFIENIQSNRSDNFPDFEQLVKVYETRIESYFSIRQKTQKIGEFSKRCADYINLILSYSEINNAFICLNLEQAEIEIRPHIEQNKYTDELTVLLSLSSTPLLINGIDPTENKITRSSNNIFSKWFKKNN